MPGVVAHLGKHVRCVGYSESYAADADFCILYTEAFAPDGSLVEEAAESALPERPVRVILELLP